MGQRALRLQARVLGKEKLHPSDLMAPPPQGPDAAAALAVPFDQSMTLIQDAVSTVHPSVGVSPRHFLMQNPTAGRHPLHIPRSQCALITETVSMIDRTSQHVCDGFNPPIRMPGKPGAIVLRILTPDIIEQ